MNSLSQKNTSRDLLRSIIILCSDEGNAELLSRHLKRMGIEDPIYKVPDVVKTKNLATEIWKRLGSFLLIVDANAQSQSASELLHELKSFVSIKHFQIIVLSEDSTDFESCKKLGCKMFEAKVGFYSDLLEIYSRIGRFIS